MGTVGAAGKARPVDRFLAFVIDAVVVFGLLLLAVWVGRILPGERLALFARPALGWVVAAAYILFRDGLSISFMDHRSIGKRMLRLRAVRDDGLPMTLGVSVRRNWPLVVAFFGVTPVFQFFAIFLIMEAASGGIEGTAGIIILAAILAFILVEAVLILPYRDGRRLGDRWAGTRVVEDHE